jgi:hypothetical protein
MGYFDLGIQKVENGFLTLFEEDGVYTQNVFEESDDEHGEIECFKRLLYSIVDHFGMTGSKHDARRIRITTGGEDE